MKEERRNWEWRIPPLAVSPVTIGIIVRNRKPVPNDPAQKNPPRKAAGDTMAQNRFCLGLLPFGPDPVHSRPLHRTRPPTTAEGGFKLDEPSYRRRHEIGRPPLVGRFTSRRSAASPG